MYYRDPTNDGIVNANCICIIRMWWMGALYGLLKDLVCRLMCASRSLQTRIARPPQDETFPNASELPLNSSNDNLNANLRPVYKGPASHRARSHTSPTIHVHTRVSLCFRKLQRQSILYSGKCMYICTKRDCVAMSDLFRPHVSTLCSCAECASVCVLLVAQASTHIFHLGDINGERIRNYTRHGPPCACNEMKYWTALASSSSSYIFVIRRLICHSRRCVVCFVCWVRLKSSHPNPTQCWRRSIFCARRCG